MTNAKLIERALRYQELRAQAAALKGDATDEGAAIVAELDRRNVPFVEHDGVRVTKTTRTRTEVDPAALKQRVKPGVFRRVVRMIVDREALDVEVKAGNVAEEDRQACSTSSTSAPYPVVTRKTAA